MQNAIEGGLSALMKTVMRLFFNPLGYNFIKGVRLPLLFGGVLVLVKLKFLCYIQDERAHKYISCARGSGGILFCSTCRNVLNVDPSKVDGQGYFVHSTCVDPSRFDHHRSGTFYDLVDKVANKAQEYANGICTNTAFNEFQTFCVRTIYCPPTHTFIDGTHCFAASSGVSQYECGFVLACIAEGITAQELDTFQAKVVWPKQARQNLPPKFFRSRVVHKPDKYVRAFAGETLSAITVLCWYFLLYMKPRQQLVERGERLLVIQFIRDLLFLLADKAVLLVDKLSEIIVLHANLILRVYGVGVAKWKFHALFHLSTCLINFSVNLNCFRGERMHVLPNQIGQHIRRLGGKEAYVIRRVLGEVLDFTPQEFQEYFLDKPSPAPSLKVLLVQLVPDVGADVCASSSMECGKVGRVHQGDLVAFSNQVGETRIGRVICLVSCNQVRRPGLLHYVCFAEFQQQGPLEWAEVHGDNRLVLASNVKIKVPYIQSRPGLVVPFSPDPLALNA